MTKEELLAVAKPILFNTEMVKAILDGRKTQTRRVIKPQPNAASLYECVGAYCFEDGTVAHARHEAGDYLYVRETWMNSNGNYYYRADFENDYLDPCETLEGGYPSECTYYPGCIGCTRTRKRIYWRPSIHMPKDAARTFLQITDVKVERLQDIDNDGAKAEGCDGRGYGPQDGATSDWIKEYDFSVEKFITVWDSTIKPADMSTYGWDANPWVWVYTFKTIKEKSQ